MKEVKDMVNFLWSHEFSVLGYFDKLGLEFPKHKKDLEAFIKDNFQACKTLKVLIEKGV